MTIPAYRLLTVLCLASFLVACEPASESHDITVFAAASLTDVVDSLAIRFEEQNAQKFGTINVAGSSLLARQIESGAKYDVFLSANAEWSRFLIGAELGRDLDTLHYSTTLVVVGQGDGTGQSPSDMLSQASRIAIGDPDHVPAGIYAKAALECMGLFGAISNRLVPTLDVRAALRSVATRSVDVSVVYETDAMALGLSYVSVPEDCQPEITYTMAVSPSVSVPGQEFYRFTRDTNQADIWMHFGFNRSDDE